MFISVVICTYNRGNILKDTLQSFTTIQQDQSFGYEMVVVDNNSTDATAIVVEGLKGHYPCPLRYIFEAQQGISHARNRGIQEAKGDIIAFVDDDVFFEVNWLVNLAKSFTELNCIGGGGRIYPKWPGDKTPWWYDARTAYAYAGVTGDLDLGNEQREFKLGHSAPFGGNMIFHRRVFEKYGLFNVSIGRKGTDLGLNEDAEFGNRLMAAGEKLWYIPEVIIYHRVFANRLKAGYLRRWYFSLGEQKVLLEKDVVIKSYLSGVPRYLYKELVQIILKSLKYLFISDFKKAFLWELRARIILGQMIQYRKQHKAATLNLNPQL